MNVKISLNSHILFKPMHLDHQASIQKMPLQMSKKLPKFEKKNRHKEHIVSTFVHIIQIHDISYCNGLEIDRLPYCSFDYATFSRWVGRGWFSILNLEK